MAIDKSQVKIGDKVYCLDENLNLTEHIISKIDTHFRYGYLRLYYTSYDHRGFPNIEIKERFLFKTIEDAKQFLINKMEKWS